MPRLAVFQSVAREEDRIDGAFPSNGADRPVLCAGLPVPDVPTSTPLARMCSVTGQIAAARLYAAFTARAPGMEFTDEVWSVARRTPHTSRF